MGSSALTSIPKNIDLPKLIFLLNIYNSELCNILSHSHAAARGVVQHRWVDGSGTSQRRVQELA